MFCRYQARIAPALTGCRDRRLGSRSSPIRALGLGAPSAKPLRKGLAGASAWILFWAKDRSSTFLFRKTELHDAAFVQALNGRTEYSGLTVIGRQTRSPRVQRLGTNRTA